MATTMRKTELTLGPVLFNWAPEIWRDFYARIADEAPVTRVYLGEVVCAKRAPLFAPHLDEVIDRLQRGGKHVVRSNLAEIMTDRERSLTAALCHETNLLVEANDAAALYHLRGRPHAVGPFVNVYNEETLAVLAKSGATHVTLPPELHADAIATLATAAKKLNMTMEVQVYGRIPLALSARCYHARAHGRVKDNCQYVCHDDPDGMTLETLDKQNFLVINGVQTLSHSCLNLLAEMPSLARMGVGAFRLSPHRQDMVATTQLFRDVLDGKTTPRAATNKLKKIGLAVTFANGFFHHEAGHRWVAPSA